VQAAGGKIPLGRRLKIVGHETVSVIVQLRAATEHTADFATTEYIEAVQLGFAELRDACKKSTDPELPPDVELTMTRFLNSVNQLISAPNSEFMRATIQI